VKYLIVNADDFGASRGINRAIAELHERGIVTSASLMITMPAAAGAVEFAKHSERLGVGLHVTLTQEDGTPLVDFDDRDRCSSEIESQIERFRAQLDRPPTHLDAHQNVHRDERLQPVFTGLAGRYGLPLREHSQVRYFSSFYGQWEDGESHPEHLSVENLLAMLDSELEEGILELSCHPGYPGDDFVSSYDRERAVEVKTLSHPRLREFLRARDVRLINFGDVQTALQDA
jgi:predicted glycoside hydrolase/deacetylase ChbG (UPF0249 family)